MERSEDTDEGKKLTDHLPDPREHKEYINAVMNVADNTQEVLNRLKNGEATLYQAIHGPLVMKQGKGQVEKQSGLIRIQIDYKIEPKDE